MIDAIKRPLLPVQTISIATDKDDSTPLMQLECAGASIGIPSGSTSGTMTFYGARSIGGDTYRIVDADGAAVDRAYAALDAVEIPPEAFAWPIIYCQSTQTVTDAVVVSRA